MNATNVTRFGCVLVFIMLALAIACSTGSQPPLAENDTPTKPPPFAESKTITVPAGTTIYVRLQQPLSSASAQVGQEFAAVLDDPLVVDNQTAVPSGAVVNGKVVAARESGHLHNAGYLRITLTSIAVNDKPVPLETNSVFTCGGSFKKRDLTFIGGGAAGGALTGGLAGGGKGTAIGTLLGGAGGTAAGYATGQKEVGFRPEQRLGFRLTQPFSTAVN